MNRAQAVTRVLLCKNLFQPDLIQQEARPLRIILGGRGPRETAHNVTQIVPGQGDDDLLPLACQRNLLDLKRSAVDKLLGDSADAKTVDDLSPAFAFDIKRESRITA